MFLLDDDFIRGIFGSIVVSSLIIAEPFLLEPEVLVLLRSACENFLEGMFRDLHCSPSVLQSGGIVTARDIQEWHKDYLNRQLPPLPRPEDDDDEERPLKGIEAVHQILREESWSCNGELT